MSEEEIDNDPEKLHAEAYAKAKTENDLLHVEHDVELRGGPADGEHFSIADGVNTLHVDVEHKPQAIYLRSEREPHVFSYYARGK